MSDSLQPHGHVHGLLCPWNSPGKNTSVGSYSLLQGIFLIQGLNLDLPHCRQILYHLSRQGSPNMSLTHATLLLAERDTEREILRIQLELLLLLLSHFSRVRLCVTP